MTELAYATLQRLVRGSVGAKDQPVQVKGDGPVVRVQFNPASLRISRANNPDRGGDSTRTEKRQYTSQEHATLTFDLEFDTAEQGSGDSYVDVREWTAVVRQFVEPPPDNPGNPPPLVRFVWGTLRFDGIVTQVNEELGYFAPNGTPLRAKVGVTVGEVDFKYEANDKGAGKRDAKAATDPGGQGAGSVPGTSGTGRPQQLVQAQAGESAQQLLARLGLDPAAWRGAMQGLDSPLSLTAGLSVQLGAEVSAAGGIGLSAGFAGTVATTSVAGLAGALGMSAGGAGGVGGAGGAAGVAAGGADDAMAAGFALSAGGGVAAALGTVLGARAAQAVDRARGAFSVPLPGGPSAAGASAGSGTNAGPSGSGRAMTGPVAGGSSYGGSYPVTDPGPAGRAGADPRALTYGQGVPLRARADPGTVAAGTPAGGRALAARTRTVETAPTAAVAPPWEQLPPPTAADAAAQCEQRRRDAPPSTLRWRPQGGLP